MPTIIKLCKQICGPSKAPGGNKPQKYFLLGSWAFFAAIGLVIPGDILEHAWAHDFTDFMAAIVPQIDRIAALGLKPEINRFHYSILWAILPIYFAVVMISGNQNIVMGHNRLSPEKIYLSLITGFLFFYFSMFLGFGFGSVDPDDRTSRILFYNPITRAIWAPIFAFGPAVFFGGILLIIKGMITGHIFKEKGGGPHGG